MLIRYLRFTTDIHGRYKFVAIQEHIVRPEPTPEQLAYRALIAKYKQQIKDDIGSIRAEKRELRALASLTHNDEDSARNQSRLSTHRRQARARHLIYGTLRGRSRDQMEPKHAEHTSNLRYWITKIWNEHADPLVPMPEALKVIE